MSSLVTWLRRLGFWVGPAVLVGSLLLAGLLVLGGITFYPLFIPALLLLVVPVGGLWLGWLLLTGSTQPWWAKLLVPVLSPLLGWLFWVLVVRPAMAPRDRLVFLIPTGFRGEVALIHDERIGNPLPEADDGDINLYVPLNGLIATSANFKSDWLTEADYYVVNAAGQRLNKLPQLNERDANRHLQPQEAHPQVGVFLAGLAYKRLHPGLAGSPRTPEAEYLSFTVAPADSLAVLMRRPAF